MFLKVRTVPYVLGWCKHNLDHEFWIIKMCSNTSSLIKMGTITINTVLPIRNKFVYSYRVKIWASGIQRTLGEHFLPCVGCMTYSWALSWGRIGPFLLTNAGSRPCSFQSFSEVMVSPGSESCSGSNGQETTKQWPWPFLGESLALGSALELLLGPVTEVVITGCCMKSTFHHMSQSNLEMVRCCCIE